MTEDEKKLIREHLLKVASPLDLGEWEQSVGDVVREICARRPDLGEWFDHEDEEAQNSFEF